MVTVEYERERGLRDVCQKFGGDFAATSSRTLNAPLTRLYRTWSNKKLCRKWLLGGEIEITTATRDKSIRAKWGGGKGRVIAMFYSKGPEKSQVTVDHRKLMSAKECANRKIHWFSALNRLQKTLRG